MTAPQTILFCAANPSETARLRLDTEHNRVREGLRLGEQRDCFQLETVTGTRSEDLRRAVLTYLPTIVHFSGHGAGEAGLAFAAADGHGAQWVSTKAIAAFFRIFASKGLRCVVLNACYSVEQADAIARHIEYVIGMGDEISDVAAIAFSTAFYDTLAAGEDFQTAYDLGCNAIDMLGLEESHTPVLKKRDAPPVPAAPEDSALTGTFVYLAETSDDLRKPRKAVKAYLEQHGITVLPARAYPGDEVAGWETACRAELEQSVLFVQLLSELNRAPQLPPLHQYQLAAGMPSLQWRAADLDEAEVEDAAYLDLLRNPQVMPTPFEDFKQEIVRVLRQQNQTRQYAAVRQAHRNNAGMAKCFVFVDAPPDNLDIARQIETWLKQHGFGVWLPDLQAPDPEDFRRDLESNLRECHVFLLLFEPALRAWLRDHLRLCDRVHALREQPVREVVIFNATGLEPDLGEFNNFRVRWLKCPRLDAPTCLPELCP